MQLEIEDHSFFLRCQIQLKFSIVNRIYLVLLTIFFLMSKWNRNRNVSKCIRRFSNFHWILEDHRKFRACIKIGILQQFTVYQQMIQRSTTVHSMMRCKAKHIDLQCLISELSNPTSNCANRFSTLKAENIMNETNKKKSFIVFIISD